MQKLIAQKRAEYYTVDSDTYDFIAQLTNSKELIKKKEKIQREDGSVEMCKALEDIKTEANLEGEEKKLIEIVAKKLRKQKTPQAIAEDLEEDIKIINNICKAAESTAPEYDCDRIYERLHCEQEM